MANILFIQDSDYELIGINCVASYIRPMHKASVIHGSFEEIAGTYKTLQPDVVGIFALTKDHNWALDIAALIKGINKSSLILLGGPHPTFYTDIINDANIDMICIGEGEKPVLNLLDAIDDDRDYTQIKSLWVKKRGKIYRNPNDTLLSKDEIPLANSNIYDESPIIKKRAVSHAMTVMCSRGCLFKCFHCANQGYNQLYDGCYFRLRNVEDIISEIKSQLSEIDIKIIKFQDDIFGANKEWLGQFLEAYKKYIGLPFYCLLTIEYIDDDLLEALKAASCFRIGIGVESGDEKIRNLILGRNTKTERIKKAAKLLHKYNISFHSFNMFGLPSENYETALKTLQLNIDIKPEAAWSALFQPYPGSKFFTEKVKPGILGRKFSRFKINHIYSGDSKRIQRLQKLFMLCVKYPLIRYILPILTLLPLDAIYDIVSRMAWKKIYIKEID